MSELNQILTYKLYLDCGWKPPNINVHVVLSKVIWNETDHSVLVQLRGLQLFSRQKWLLPIKKGTPEFTSLVTTLNNHLEDIKLRQPHPLTLLLLRKLLSHLQKLEENTSPLDTDTHEISVKFENLLNSPHSSDVD